MAKSLVEKFEQILTADPASMVFVELAKSLLDQGQVEKAIQVCQSGVGHHPDSILGRVLLGRATLAGLDWESAQRQFDRALAIDPQNPYGYNLVAESLMKAGRFAQALPVLRQALVLQPSDLRLQQWIAQAEAGERGPVPSEYSHIDPLASLNLRLGQAEDATGTEPAGSPLALAPPPLPQRAPDRPVKPRVADLLLAGLPEPAPNRQPIQPPTTPTVSEVARIARSYEDTLRQEFEQVKQKPKSLLRRYWLPVALAGTTGLGAIVWLVGSRLTQQRYAEQHASDFITQARQGLLQATRSSLSGALHLMTELLQVDPHRGGALAVAAQAEAMLCHDFGCSDPDQAQAASWLADPAASAADPDASLAAKVYLAGDADALADELLAAPLATAGPWVHFLSGKALLARHNEAEALKRFDLGLKLAPGHVPMLVAVGENDLQKTEFASAAGLFALAHTASPLNVAAAVGLTEAHLALHEGLEVTADDEKGLVTISATGPAAIPGALRQRLDFAEARVLATDGKLEQAVKLLADAVAQHADEYVAYEGALADCYAADGQYDRAEVEAWRALTKIPRDPEALARYGEVLLARDRDRDLLQRVTVVQNSRRLHVLRAKAALRSGNLALARQEIEATRRDNRAPVLAGVLLGEVEIKEGHPSEARAALEQIASRPRPPAEVFLDLANLDVRSDSAAALSELRRAVQVDPRSYEAHCALGRMLARSPKAADQSEAEVELLSSIRLDQQHVESRVALGLLDLEHNRPAEARPILEAAVREAPQDSQANLALARTLLALSQNTDAVHAAARAAKAAPQDPRTHHWLGKIALAIGDRKLALKELRQAKKLDKSRDRAIGSDLASAERKR